MTKDFSVNPFDTPLGNRFPLPSHKAFLVNFLSLLATPVRENMPAANTPDIISRAVDLAYVMLADKENAKPRLYHQNTCPELNQILVREHIPLDLHTKWWEVVDALFERGLIHEAIQAQRYAVPLLDDVAAQITQNAGIINSYDENLCHNVHQRLLDSINAYSILKQPTQFDLGDAQVVSLDLDEVAPRGGNIADRQSAVMYMLARHILGSRFFLMPDDVKLRPELYQDYHAERIEAIREDPKRICYENSHRIISRANQVLLC